MSKQQRIAFAAIAAVIAVVAVIVLAGGSGDDEEAAAPTTTATPVPQQASPVQTPEATATETPTPEPTPRIETIVVRGGTVQGGEAEIEADKGDTVRFRVRSDIADEVHVHGYDVKKNVTAGGSATLSFEANIVGIFEIELEGAHLPIGRLRVNP